jgi:hypothetical protein
LAQQAPLHFEPRGRRLAGRHQPALALGVDLRELVTIDGNHRRIGGLAGLGRAPKRLQHCGDSRSGHRGEDHPQQHDAMHTPWPRATAGFVSEER